MKNIYVLLWLMLLAASVEAQQARGKKLYRAAAFNINAAGATVNFTNTSPGSGYSCSWDFGDNSAVSAQKNPAHTFTKDGIYNVCLTITDSAGNWDYQCQEIKVDATGIPQHHLSSNLLLYPNPSNTGIVTLDLTRCNAKEVSITVYNITGKTVYERIIKSSHIEKHAVDLTEEPAGNYFMTIKAGQETITKRVWIK